MNRCSFVANWVESLLNLGAQLFGYVPTLVLFLLIMGDVSQFIWNSGGKEGSYVLGSLRNCNEG